MSETTGDNHAGCSKSSSSKATASEDPEAYPLGYVEDLSDARTTLANFFSILLDDLAVLHMHDAVGLGRQLVVVGDDHEGRPTGFV